MSEQLVTKTRKEIKKNSKKDKLTKKSYNYTKNIILNLQSQEDIYKSILYFTKHQILVQIAISLGIKTKKQIEMKTEIPKALINESCINQEFIDLKDLYLDFVSGDNFYELQIINHKNKLLFFLCNDLVHEINHNLVNEYHQSIVFNQLFYTIGSSSSFSLDLNDLEQGVTELKLNINRIDYTICKYQEKLYIFGGEDSKKNFVNDFQVYDFNEIRIFDNHGPKISKHKSVVFFDEMIVIGGKKEGKSIQKKFMKSIYIFSFKTLQWRKVKTKGKHPPKLTSPSCSIDQNFIYIHGGSNGIEDYGLNDIYQLNLLTFEWNFVGYMEPRIQNSLMLIKGSRIYSFGGTSIFEPIGPNVVSIYTLEEHRYLTLKGIESKKFKFIVGEEIFEIDKILVNQINSLVDKNEFKIEIENIEINIFSEFECFLRYGFFRSTRLKEILHVYRLATLINFENLKNYCVEIIYSLKLNNDEILVLREVKDRALYDHFVIHYKSSLNTIQKNNLKSVCTKIHPKYKYILNRYIDTLISDKKTFDVLIKTKKINIRAHKSFLSKLEYFKMMFQFEEGSKSIIEMKNTSPDIITMILEFVYFNMYPSQFISMKDLLNLLKFSNQMLIYDLEIYTTYLIITKLNRDNIKEVLGFSQKYEFKNLENALEIFYLSKVKDEKFLISLTLKGHNYIEEEEEELKEEIEIPKKKQKIIIDDE